MKSSLASKALAVWLLSMPLVGAEPVQDRMDGSIRQAGGKEPLQRVTGKARVLDATTLELQDGTRVDLNIAAPDPDQMATLGDTLYPCGKEAAEFLRILIGESPVTCFEVGDAWSGYVGDTDIKHAMIIGGWALANHRSMRAAEAIARENKRGLWRRTFVDLPDWRAGVRLPGEPPPPRLINERQAEGLLAEHGGRETACETLIARIVQDLPTMRRLRFPKNSSQTFQLTDDDLAQLSRLTTLEELDLSSCGRITDAGLAHLKALPRLKQLDAPYGTTDVGLEHLATLSQLERLWLGHWLGWAITDAGLARLKGLHRLRWLTLYYVQVTDAGLEHLRNLPNLVVLEFGRVTVTDAGIVHLKEITNLKYLDISDTEITDAGVEQLKALKRLRVLLLPKRVSQNARDRLREALPELKFEGKPEDVLADPKKVGDSQS